MKHFGRSSLLAVTSNLNSHQVIAVNRFRDLQTRGTAPSARNSQGSVSWERSPHPHRIQVKLPPKIFVWVEYTIQLRFRHKRDK